MKKDRESGPSRPRHLISNRWTRRALLLAAAVIIVGTLFPYQFLPKETAYRRTVSLLLWLDPSPTRLSDFLENVLLFLPFGFGIASWSFKRNWERFWGVLAAFAGGAAFSFLLEFLQVFLPSRTPEWWDVIADSMGSALGFLIFGFVGAKISGYASALEGWILKSLTGRRIAACFLAYFGLMTVCSSQLQRSTNLTHWQQDDTLFVGNDFSSHHLWQGRILRLEMADEVVTPDYFSKARDAAGRIIAGKSSEASHLVIELSAREGQTEEDNPRAQGPQQFATGQAPTQTGMGSIQARIPATDLVNAIGRTNRFSLRLQCIPSAAATHAFGTILTLSGDPRYSDLYLIDVRGRWVVGMRAALAGKSRYWDLALSNIPINGGPVEVFVTYNGADLVATVNGKQLPQSLPLNPGANLVRFLKGVGAGNVYGYGLVYDGLVFAPLGILLAMAVRIPGWQNHRRRVLLVAGFLLPPPILEVVLTLVSRRPFYVENVILGICMVLGAFLIWSAEPMHDLGSETN